MIEQNGQQQDICFTLVFNPQNRNLSWRVTPGFPYDALVNGLELAKTMYVNQELAQILQASQQPNRVSYPDGTPFAG